MTQIKLQKIPDRVPIKLTISLAPELKAALDEYAIAYETAYQVGEPPVIELIPAMLSAFLESDRFFAKTRKA